MPLTEMPDFTFKYVDQADQVSGDPAAFKTNMDSQPKAIRDFINGTHKTEIDTHLAETVCQIIRTTRDVSLTTSQIISGFTGIPKYLKILTNVGASKKVSNGTVPQSGTQVVTYLDAATSNWYSLQGYAIAMLDSTTAYTIGAVAINSNNTITITWTKTGAGATGTADITVEAYYH